MPDLLSLRLLWIGKLKAAGIPDPEISVDELLAKVFSTSRQGLIRFWSSPISSEKQSQFEQLGQRRMERVPLQYLLEEWTFFDLTLSCRPGTLIPRPETEDWLEVFARSILLPRLGNSPWLFADIGTGTGAIGLYLRSRFPRSHGILSDRSPLALQTAAQNLRLHPQLARNLMLVCAHLTIFLKSHSIQVLVSNPPYIPSEEIPQLMPEVRDHEPHQALDGGKDGLKLIGELLLDAGRVLQPGGILALEHGHGQRSSILCLPAPDLVLITPIDDAAGRERAIIWQRGNTS